MRLPPSQGSHADMGLDWSRVWSGLRVQRPDHCRFAEGSIHTSRSYQKQPKHLCPGGQVTRRGWVSPAGRWLPFHPVGWP